ncbi:MAG: TIR domain-containing protein [Anaerolineales bacterium]
MNPFTCRGMIKDPGLFSGRTEELENIKNLLLTMQSCSVVGPRRIGKSSLLFYLSHPSYHTKIYPPEYRFVFLDLQELSGSEIEDFFTTVIKRLRRTSPELIAADAHKDATMAGFRRLLGDLSDNGAKLVLCLDEFEMLSQNPNFSTDFFTFLRGLCSNYSFALVTSSRKSLFDLCHQRDIQTSQLWNIFVELPLGLMKSDETQTLVQKYFERGNLSVSQEYIDKTVALAGNHPFFLQIAFSFLYDACVNEQDPDFRTIHERFTAEARRHYVFAWDQLSKQCQEILYQLEQHLGPINNLAFQTLKREALLEGSANHPKLTSNGLREFVKLQNTENIPNDVDAASKSESISATSARIFVSYRRTDSADITGRIYDRLIGRFGKEPIFKDVDSIPLGLDFREYLDVKVSECDVLLAIIGDHWLDKDSSGERRLDDPGDFVRIEIQSALKRGIPVIPLLVRGVQMPREEDLPASLRKLVYRNGIPIRSDPDFHRDMDRLIAALETHLR